MKWMIIVLLAALCWNTGCKPTAPEHKPYTSREHGPSTSLIALIASPESWDEGDVMVEGFAHFEFEGNCLYLHEDDYRHGIRKNALWVDLPEDLKSHIPTLNDKYIWVHGTFDAHMIGHGGLNSGGIKDIQGIGVHDIRDGSEPTKMFEYFRK